MSRLLNIGVIGIFLAEFSYGQGKIDVDNLSVQMGMGTNVHVNLTASNFTVQDAAGSTLISGDFSTGNVGIGKMPSSSVSLDVLGQDVNFFSNNATNNLLLGRDGAQYLKLHVSDYHGYIDYQQDADQGQDQIFYIRSLNSSTGRNDIRFETGGNDRLTIEEGGNVGIGTTDPGQKLEVSGNIKASGNVRGGTVNYGEMKMTALQVVMGAAGNTEDVVIGPKNKPLWARITLFGQQTNLSNQKFYWDGIVTWDSSFNQNYVQVFHSSRLSAQVVTDASNVKLRISYSGSSNYYAWLKGTLVVNN